MRAERESLDVEQSSTDAYIAYEYRCRIVNGELGYAQSRDQRLSVT